MDLVLFIIGFVIGLFLIVIFGIFIKIEDKGLIIYK